MRPAAAAKRAVRDAARRPTRHQRKRAERSAAKARPTPRASKLARRPPARARSEVAKSEAIAATLLRRIESPGRSFRARIGYRNGSSKSLVTGVAWPESNRKRRSRIRETV